MTIAFYEHPFSSYVQKAKTALYEKGIPFESKMIDGSEPVASEFAALWPIPPCLSTTLNSCSRRRASHRLYADWTHPIPERFAAVHAYRQRLLGRPSYARALDDARPYRKLFPLGAPVDRD